MYSWRRGSVVRASVTDWRTFSDMHLIWLTCDHFVGKASAMGQPTRPTQPLPSVGWGMSSISVARWVKLLAAVSPSSECLYEGKADVVYLQVTVWSTSERLVVEILTIGAIHVHFLSCPFFSYKPLYALKQQKLNFDIDRIVYIIL